MKKILTLLILLLAGICIAFYVFKSNFNSFFQQQRTADGTVIKEKIKEVTKLISIEGYFSEVYENTEYWGYNLSPLRKKALIRVKAKVSVGYDFTNLKIESFPDKKIIKIGRLPDPEILSIDHDLDYYDISEGTFNSFNERDFNKMNAEAKAKIEKAALESDLLLKAEKQSAKIFNMMELIVESSGWTIEYEKRFLEEIKTPVPLD